MGEYAEYNGEQIKIGTNEDMYYLRADQMNKVRPERFTWSDDILAEMRFRFPFPNEDHIAPGDFDDSDFGLGLYGWEPPAEGIEHKRVQLKSSHPRGVMAMLPCPYSMEGRKYEESGLVHYQFNGYPGPIKLTQIRKWAGVWVPVFNCGGCGMKFRLGEYAQVEPILMILGTYAANADRDQDQHRAEYYRTIRSRIIDGFDGQIPGAVKVATKKAAKTRVTESTGDPGKWQAQYYSPDMKLWFDIGDTRSTQEEAESVRLEYVERHGH